MFPGLSIYLLMTVLIFWTYCGYIWLLFLFYILVPDKCRSDAAATEHPVMTVLVPCYNERALVAQKVADLAALRYPAGRLAVVFLDGRSTDGTPEALRELTANRPGWSVVDTGVSGKIRQLNCGLSRLGPEVEVVVNTDMDTLLAPDVLERFAAELSRDARVAVLGANISPNGCIPIERSYWESNNTMRLLESAVYASSIIVAPCYAFRRDLFDRFPEDCVADDIYVAFLANTRGLLTKYVTEAHGQETRTPTTLESFFHHKFRKGNAYLQEVLRILYKLPSMTGWWKLIYLTKLLQLAVIPWLLPYFLLSTLSFLLSGGGLLQVAVLSCAGLAGSTIVSSLAVARFKRLHFNGCGKGAAGILAPFILANIVLMLVGTSYPFFRQNSQYARIEAA